MEQNPDEGGALRMGSGGATQSASVNSVLEAGDSAARYRTGEFILEHCNFSVRIQVLNVGGLHSYVLCPYLLRCSWLSGRNGRGLDGKVHGALESGCCGSVLCPCYF